MVNEVINIGVGSAGLNILNSIYSQLTLEHQVEDDGTGPKDIDENNLIHNNFNEKDGKFSAKCLFFGSELSNINNVLSGPRRKLFNSSNLVCYKESSASNYCRAHYTIGRVKIDAFLDQTRKEVEKCNNFDGFHIHGTQVAGSAGSMT